MTTDGAWRELPWLTIVLAGSMAAVHAVLGPAAVAWIYDRVAIVDGEWWRLFSGHWVHGDAGHLGWNQAGLLLLGAMVERRSRPLLLAGLLAGSLGVDVMLWFAMPELGRYCGLSGVLNALLLPALLLHRRAGGNGVLWLIAALSLGKILAEMARGDALFTHTLWVSLPASHLAGWLAGLLVAGFLWRARRLRYLRSMPAVSTSRIASSTDMASGSMASGGTSRVCPPI